MAKYNFMETIIANEKYLHYHPEGRTMPEHRNIILKNAERLRIVSYNHQSPDGTESICYAVHGYIPLEKTFRRRLINFEELILLLYGIVHTISNAGKCGLLEDSFILNPSHVYLNHDSIQPYLMYLPIITGTSLQDEFLALMSFLNRVADPGVPNTKKLVSVIRDIALEDFDMQLIINVVVQAANKKKVIAPKRTPKPVQAPIPVQTPEPVQTPAPEPVQTPAPAPVQSQQTSPNVSAADVSQSTAKQDVQQSQQISAPAPKAQPMPKTQPAPRPVSAAKKPAPTAPSKQQEQKQGFFARFFGFGIKQKEPDDFLPTIDDRTMIDFTAYGDEDGRPVLYVMDGDSRTVQIPVTKDAFLIGRDRSKVDHCFDGAADKGISREHAAIIFDGSNYFVVDKGSSGGTFVNDVRLAPNGSAALTNGDVISLYTKKLLFEIED